MRHIIALSGGRDSTSLALLLREQNPTTNYEYLITPTGDELPPMVDHWARLETLLGKPLTRIYVKGGLSGMIEKTGVLPNFRFRWCTYELKIKPCLAFLADAGECTLYVGLRADEEERTGIYGTQPNVTVRFPLREQGVNYDGVSAILDRHEVCIPDRTDCARCPFQRLGQWQDLHDNYPAIYADAESQEIRHGHTFRSPGRDTRPAPLVELRVLFASANGKRYGHQRTHGKPCRVCSL